MGGRINGFLGGVLLTGTITYLTTLEFHAKQLAVSNALKESNDTIYYHGRPVEPKSNIISYKTRTLKESVKDIWNYEIINGVNWLYSFDLGSWSKKMLDSLTPKQDSAPAPATATSSESN